MNDPLAAAYTSAAITDLQAAQTCSIHPATLDHLRDARENLNRAIETLEELEEKAE
jgi:hypothetical protein